MVKVVPEESVGINPHVKEGVYPARLAGVVEKVLEVEKKDAAGKGTGVKEQVPRWEWVLALRAPDGDKVKDQRFTVLTSPKMTTKSKAYAFAKALRGGKVVELGVEFDTDALVGSYVNVTAKDKNRTDRTGNIQVASEITDMTPIAAAPTPEISIEGLIVEDEEDQPVPPTSPAKKGKK